MQILNISTQPIKTEFTTQNATLELQTTPPKIQMNTEPVIVEIRQPQGKLEIDQTPCRYAYGIKNMQDLSRDNAQAGKDAALAVVGRIAEEGDRLANIESQENAVIEMAADSTSSEMPEITWAHVPLPDISYTPGELKINITGGKTDVNIERGSLQGNYHPGKLEINVTQYPSIKMWTTENKVDVTIK